MQRVAGLGDRVARCSGCRIFKGHFPQKSPIITGSFAERDLQLKASNASWPSGIGSEGLGLLYECTLLVAHRVQRV